MVFHVPVARSCPSFPAMVTVPGLVACLYCGWLGWFSSAANRRPQLVLTDRRIEVIVALRTGRGGACPLPKSGGGQAPAPPDGRALTLTPCVMRYKLDCVPNFWHLSRCLYHG